MDKIISNCIYIYIYILLNSKQYYKIKYTNIIVYKKYKYKTNYNNKYIKIVN